MPSGRLAPIFAAPLLAWGIFMLSAPGRLYGAEATARLITESPTISIRKEEKMPPAVIWLKPLQSGGERMFSPGNYTLQQKAKMFTPHLLVVPVGSSVAFPNTDPFFHNVFSLFDGKRFDLGLYESGSTRSVVFSREGVSYIFCNIHSEMSAVVIALDTPLYAIADARGEFHLKDVPDGDYDLHMWVEGQRQTFLDQQTRRVHVAGDAVNLGIVRAMHPDNEEHLNKFGRPYEPESKPVY
jgi:plastocyanin